jgi:hypothetical protein
MRLALAVFLLAAACGAKPASGPAWPKMSERETDGGESIEPRAGASAIAAAAAADDADDDDKDAVIAPADPTDAKPETPKAATPGTPAPPPDDIVITTEEIVIEVDD